MFSRFPLQVTGDDPGLADGIHIVGIKGENLIHPFQFDDDAVIDRDSAAGNTGTGRTRRNRYQVFIGQFDDFRHFFRRAREDDDFRFMEIMRVPFFIGLISFEIIVIGLNELIPQDAT